MSSYHHMGAHEDGYKTDVHFLPWHFFRLTSHNHILSASKFWIWPLLAIVLAPILVQIFLIHVSVPTCQPLVDFPQSNWGGLAEGGPIPTFHLSPTPWVHYWPQWSQSSYDGPGGLTISAHIDLSAYIPTTVLPVSWPLLSSSYLHTLTLDLCIYTSSLAGGLPPRYLLSWLPHFLWLSP